MLFCTGAYNLNQAALKVALVSQQLNCSERILIVQVPTRVPQILLLTCTLLIKKAGKSQEVLLLSWLMHSEKRRSEAVLGNTH